MRDQLTRHHLTPKQRSKTKTHKDNQSKLHLHAVLRLWRDKHTAWHFLFQNMTLDEIIECLERIKRIKQKTPL